MDQEVGYWGEWNCRQQQASHVSIANLSKQPAEIETVLEEIEILWFFILAFGFEVSLDGKRHVLLKSKPSF